MCHALDVEEFLLFLNKFHRALALLRGRPFDARGGGRWHVLEINILTLKMLSSSGKKINNLTITCQILGECIFCFQSISDRFACNSSILFFRFVSLAIDYNMHARSQTDFNFFRLASLTFNYNMSVLVSHLRKTTHMTLCTTHIHLLSLDYIKVYPLVVS